MALTDLQVKKLSPRSDRYEVSDGKGLSIRVAPGGTKTWIYRYTIEGKPWRMTLGKYPGIGLAVAREAHAKAMQEVQRGINPGRKQQEAKAERMAAPTIAKMLDEFWEIELRAKKSGMETHRLLQKDIFPKWGTRKVADLKRRDIVLLIDDIRDRAPITANRVLGALTRFFNFAAERGIIDDSPCLRIRKPKETGRARVLTDDEIRLLWKALEIENKTIDMYVVSKLAMRMILLTGQRPGEVCNMAWSELDDNGCWNIPAERMKGNEDHRVPLCDMALKVIEQARPYSGDSTYVFRSSYNDDSPMTAHALSRALVRHWEEIGYKEDAERFTPHDPRRTLRTRLAALGVTDIVAERVLGHKLQGVLAVYNRYDYDQEKRQALDMWERELRRIIGIEIPRPGKVVAFRRKSS